MTTKQQPSKYSAEREARVAAALRENLLKRKEQARLREQAEVRIAQSVRDEKEQNAETKANS